MDFVLKNICKKILFQFCEVHLHLCFLLANVWRMRINLSPHFAACKRNVILQVKVNKKLQLFSLKKK